LVRGVQIKFIERMLGQDRRLGGVQEKMKRMKPSLSLLGSSAVLVGVAMLLTVIPTAGGATGGELTTSGAIPHLSLAYREVAANDVCDNYNGYSCAYCEFYGSMEGTSHHINDICTDVLTAFGAEQKWHAYYYSFNDPCGRLAAVSLNNTQGVLYPGQSLQFVFGLNIPGNFYGCYQGNILKITGTLASSGQPTNSVWIGYGGDG
jgi:hypothetical protein